MTNRRELNKIKSRKNILRASRRLFSQKGYEETMMEDIAVRAEVSRATIYNYFPNKESLLIGTADEVIERIRDSLNKELKDVESSEKKLKLVLDELITSSVEYLSLSRRITYLNSEEDSPIFKTREDLAELFKELIIGVQEENGFHRDASVEDIVDVVMGIYLIALFEWSHIDEYTPEFLQVKIDRFFDLMLSPFRP
ncbi:MAG: TetR/AcrR family transcriptional regulator [Clostridiaceae bacterium]|jgi:AcrR family transcriptional regulator|nr:TetR/AcrR family transcriptional regulator [Clostridiales bacterium]NLG30075.1 TetR/AcrR family transcriptional regulator [Clostridiaceae bacterium]